MHDNELHKYYGIYRATVFDAKDPDELGRIRMTIPQVLGPSVTNWAWHVGGAVAQAQLPYGTFSSSQTQPVAAANTATVVSFNVVEDINNMKIVNGTRISVNENGDYFFQFSAQFNKSGGNSAQADIWLRKNGVNIERSNSRATLQGNPNEVLITLNYILDLKKDDYIEVVFSSSDSGVNLIAYPATTSPTRPALPSIIATLNLIGKFVPQPGTGVWAMFEGGDINFPLWIGTN